MKYQIQIPDKIKKVLKKIPEKDSKRIVESINFLIEDPRPNGCKKIKGTLKDTKYRIRCGNYRVVYSVKDDVLIILIVEVGHRKDVYR